MVKTIMLNVVQHLPQECFFRIAKILCNIFLNIVVGGQSIKKIPLIFPVHIQTIDVTRIRQYGKIMLILLNQTEFFK